MSLNKLSDEEIILFMREFLSISLTRDQLVNPTKNIVIRLYSRFLYEFGFQDITKPDIIATSAMDNIETYDSFIKTANVFNCTAYVISAAGIPDMSINDIISPKRKRTNRILSALCILSVKLSNIQYEWYQLEQKNFDLPQKRSAIKKQIKDLKRSIEEKSVGLSANKNTTIAMNFDLNKLALNYKEKVKLAEDLKEVANNLKTNVLKKKEEVSEIDVRINVMKGKIDKLDKKLIRSPDRLQAKIEQKEKVLQNKRNLKKKLERQQFLLFSSMNELKESSKSLKPSLETFKEGVKELEKIRNQIKLLDETKAEINNNDKKLKALKIQLREHEKTIRTMRRKIVINEKQHEKQIETMKQINNGIKRELEAMQKNQSDQLQRSLEDKIKLEKRLDSLESEHQKFKNASQMYYRQHLASLQMIKTLINTRLNEFQNLKGVKKNFLI